MQVILYSTGCPKCKMLKAKLDTKGIKYDVVTDVNVMESKGFMSVPMLEINGEVMNYMKADEWIKNYKGEN